MRRQALLSVALWTALTSTALAQAPTLGAPPATTTPPEGAGSHALAAPSTGPATSTTPSSGRAPGESHEGAAASPTAASPTAASPTRAPVAAPPTPACAEAPPVFDPSTPRLELQAGGGYAGFFTTFRQSSDNFMTEGAHPDGAYLGPLLRGELAFALGGLSLSAIYTHIASQHEGTAHPLDWQLVSGEIGVQCACRGSTYVWSFGLEAGWNLNAPSLFVSIEHRSMFYVWGDLFLGFDVDLATFVGMSFGGPSGGGILGSVFLGYSIE